MAYSVIGLYGLMRDQEPKGNKSQIVRLDSGLT